MSSQPLWEMVGHLANMHGKRPMGQQLFLTLEGGEGEGKGGEKGGRGSINHEL